MTVRPRPQAPARLQAWYATAVDKPKERLAPDFLRVLGLDPLDIQLSEQRAAPTPFG